jgi:DNA-binding transcriptional regulator YiaG
MDYSKAIKELRERMMLSQEEFAEKLGVSFATVNRWENGHHEPTYKARRQIAALCKKHGIKIGSESND